MLRWGKSEASHSGLRGTAVVPGRYYGIAEAAIRQPAGVAAVQPGELPGGVELAHRGDLGPVLIARLLARCQVQLVWVREVVHVP